MIGIALCLSLAPIGDPSATPTPAPSIAGLLSKEPRTPYSVLGPPLESDQDSAFRLNTAFGTPEWLSISGSTRVRYEALSDAIRFAQSGSNHLFAFKTMIAATARVDESVRVTGELIDSRANDFPSDAILDTGTVNAVELLQGFVGIEFDDISREGDHLDVQIGRHTMDVGSRRLAARNRYRNTVNSFTGVNAVWRHDDSGHQLRAFAVVPVWRLPRRQDALRDNEIEFDEEQEETLFFGLHSEFPVAGKLLGEGYAFHIAEDDESGVPTRNRDITTVGVRLRKMPETNRAYFEWESAIQFGKSRATRLPADTTDLDHWAQFHHLTYGYRFEGAQRPELELLLDYASGDDDPTDGDNNRFDTLFGARRFEFGPTGIFGAFARSNMFSPGLRTKFRVGDRTKVMIASRMHYLASDQDVWTTTGLFDPSGSAGSYIGNLSEIRVRYVVVPDSLQLETGFAHFEAGSFVEDAPNATGQGDSNYTYVALTLTF